MLYLRFTNHINEDLERGWSSWEFGNGGFKGTAEDLAQAIKGACDETESFWISGDMVEDEEQAMSIAYGELYPNYWVQIDLVNSGSGALSCHELDVDTIEDAISLMGKYPTRYNGDGDGDSISADSAEVVYEGEVGGRKFVLLRDSGKTLRTSQGACEGCISYYKGNIVPLSYIL